MKNTKYPIIPLEKEENLKQFIRGSLLGDGSIPKLSKGSKNYRLTFGHSEKQKEYLEWKHNFLENYLMSGKIQKVVSISNRYLSGSCTSFHFKSISHPIFSYYRSLYYNHKKIINIEDIRNMNEFALAIWYMDDGNISKRKKRSPHIELNTQSFTPEEVNELCNLLISKWNIRCARMNYSNIIRISSLDCNKFLKIIEPYKIKCMSYKWVLNKEEELLEN